MLHVEIAVSKAPKYAVRESGDSVEVIERPHGGLSLVMTDGQRSGRSAKAISNIVVRKAVSLLAEGVRDGAVARATHDYLRTQRSGQVSAELTIVSVDLETRTVVITRNSRCPVLIALDKDQGAFEWQTVADEAEAIGIHSRSRPAIAELPLAAGQTIILFTDGMLHAGERRGTSVDVRGTLAGLPRQAGFSARLIADTLLGAALAADDGRLVDDTSVVALRVTAQGPGDHAEVRRMSVSFPVPPV